MGYTHIVWDFNGTLLDDVAPCIDVLNTLLIKRGLKTVTEAEYKQVFGFPIKDYYKKVGFDFTKEDYSLLAVEWGELYKNAAKDSTLGAGVKEALEHFKGLGKTQIILSATELGMLKQQLGALGIADYFSETLALSDMHAVSKVQLGIDWVKNTKPEKALFIGDTEHDCETAKAMGVDCILVACGHQCKERLNALGVPVVDTVADVIGLVNS